MFSRLCLVSFLNPAYGLRAVLNATSNKCPHDPLIGFGLQDALPWVNAGAGAPAYAAQSDS